MGSLYLACANNKFIRYARVSGWVQEKANAISLVRNACSLSALSFYIMTALSRHAFPGWCIRHGCSFSLLLGRYIAGAVLIVVTNSAFPRRAIAAVLVYLFHSIVFSFLVTRPDVFLPSLSLHYRNLYFCYYWKSSLPGARWKFISEQSSLSLSLSLSFSFFLFLFFLSFLSFLFLSVSHSRHRLPRS